MKSLDDIVSDGFGSVLGWYKMDMSVPRFVEYLKSRDVRVVPKVRPSKLPTDMLENLVQRVARITYAATQAYARDVLGDTSLPADYDDAPPWARESHIMGVGRILSGEIRSPEDSHLAWMEHKEDEGWVYGPVKDIEAKTHPSLIPYDELPDTERRKDHIFFGVALAFIEDAEP